MVTKRTAANAIDEWIFVYTADDERLWTFSPGRPSRWTIRDLNAQVLRDYRQDGSTWTVDPDYIQANGRLLAAEAPSNTTGGTTHHFHPDHLGTPRLITDQNGTKDAYHAYYPFGEEATFWNQDSERMKFTGHERDFYDPAGDGDDLDYQHARYYTLTIGRFLGVDPLPRRKALASPQALNGYAYTLNNPLAFTDPNGECAVPAGLESGQVGICIEAFIASARIGGLGLGDKRSFTPNDPSATARLSLKMRIDPKSKVILEDSIKAGASKVGLTDRFSIGLAGEATLVKGSYTAGDSMELRLFMQGTNGWEFANDFGTIEALIHLSISENGEVQLGPGSTTKEYPSIEGYSYTFENGVLVIQTLFQELEDDPEDLKGSRKRRLDSACSQASFLPACD